MPNLKRAPNERELQKLIALFLRAETDIINEIGRLRSQGSIDYHAVAALERVQTILRNMENEAWEYVPKMIEKQFYVRVPEARRIEGETVEKHMAGYANATALTGEQHAVIDMLVTNLMGEITDASMTVMATLQSALIGRIEPDIYRQIGLEQVALQQAKGKGTYKMLPEFVEALRREGVTAFVDKAGRNWSLHTYGSMASRTTSRQAEVLAVLTADPEQDLYQISSHGTTCKICAPFEGRVYSKSGTDPDFPPLAAAFGKVDVNGPDNLTNTWLNIHPNCLVPGGLVLAEGVMAHSSREYSGPVITLETSHGNRITVTPNHPILTTKGFIAAGMLQKEDKVIEATGEYRFLFGKAPNDINVPTPIEDIGHSIVQAGSSSSVRVKGSPVQFHGDGSTNSEVDIVFSNGFRVGESNVLRSKPIRKHFLPTAHLRRISLFSRGPAFQVIKRAFHTAYSRVCRSRFVRAVEGVPVQCEKLSHIRQGPSASVGNLRVCKPLTVELKKPLKFFRSSFQITGRNIKKFLLRFLGKHTVVNHSALDGVLGYSELFRNLSISEPLASQRLQDLFRDNALVVSELLHISTSNYTGKVYNLQTKYGFYTYNSIVTHNCLHVLLPWTAAGRSEEEIQKIKDFSNPKKNPFSKDPRTEKQIAAYRKKEAARAQWLRDYRQWEDYRITLGNKIPKTFATFQKIKYNDRNRWKQLKSLYRKNHNYLQERLDYKWNGEESFIPANAVITSARTIAGNGSKTALRSEDRLIEKFGGSAGEWKKRVGKVSSSQYDFDVHWYELDGKQYLAKLKHRKEK